MKDQKNSPSIITQFAHVAATFADIAAQKYGAYRARENEKYRAELAKQAENNYRAVAFQEYQRTCAVVSEVLAKNATTLGLLAPGHPKAVMLKDCFYINKLGECVFCVKIQCRASNTVSQRALWSDLQDAIDAHTFFNDLLRLYVGGLTACGGGSFVAALSWREWQ